MTWQVVTLKLLWRWWTVCGNRQRGVLHVKVGHWGLLTLKREIFQLPNLLLPVPTLWYKTGGCTEPANTEETSQNMALCHTNPRHSSALWTDGDELIGSSPQENGLRILAGETSHTWWQCVLCVPACMKRSPAQVKGGDPPPPPVLMRAPDPEQCPAPEPPVHRPALVHPQNAQRAGTPLLWGKDETVGTFELGEERAWGRLHCCHSAHKEGLQERNLFTKACSDRTQGSSFKLKGSRFRLDIRKNFFMMKGVRCYNTCMVTGWKQGCQEKLGMPHHWKCSKSG